MKCSMPIDWFPLWLSLRVAVISTAIALAIGSGWPTCWRTAHFAARKCWTPLSRCPWCCRPPCSAIICWFCSAAPVPLGKFYQWLFGSPLVFTWQAAVVAALLHSTPLLVKSARAAFESVDRRYERAARTLGARNGACSGASRCRWRAARFWPPRRSPSRDRWAISASP